MGLGYLLFIIPFVLMGNFVKRRLLKTFGNHAAIAVSSGMAGAEVARAILDANGMQSVSVGMAKGGPLSDHYDPRTRSVNLSEAVYGQRSLAASAVAAHEVGHAMQHLKGSALFSFRSALFKPAALGSRVWIVLLIASSFLRSPALFIGALALYGLVVLFQLVTLPVELDASRRANNELDKFNLVNDAEEEGARKVLGAAAWTYVAGALASIGQLAMYALPLLLGGRAASS
jgi:uncharacterized protein